MSLESLQALKSLVQVREQGASIQGDNLEQVQSKVQQLGTSEAKRVDDLHLETAKAQYEVSLTQAKIERLASQLVRETKAVQNANLITIGVAALSIGTNAGFFFSDVTGKNKLSDSKSAKGNSLNDFKDKQGGATIVDTKTGTTGAKISKVSGQDENGNQSVVSANVNGAGAITGVRASIITQDDLRSAAKDVGLTVGTGKNNTFTLQDLQKANPEAASKLITSKSRDVERSESSAAIDAFAQEGGEKLGTLDGKKDDSVVDKVNKNIETSDRRGGGKEKLSAAETTANAIGNKIDKIRGISAETSISNRVQDHLEGTGVHESGLKKTGDALKSGANALVSIASDVSPFYQAYLKMKTQRDNTADELQAEVAKLAAERKKLKALELAIQSPGAGEEGSGAGEASKAKA